MTATQMPPIPIAVHSIQEPSAVASRRSWDARASFDPGTAINLA